MEATAAQQLAALVERHLGMTGGSANGRALAVAVQKRMEARGVTLPVAYLQLVRTDRGELSELVEAVVVPETWFFRYAESFRHLGEWAVKRRTEPGNFRPLRVLTVPCSTGEEPYSVAIALLAAGVPAAGFKVDAVDVSRRAVEVAKAGVYAPSAFREAVDPNHARYLDRTGSDVAVVPEVRAAVGFRVGNLTDPTFLAGEPRYDAIFCRNLFIYLAADARKAAVAAFDRLLAPDGLIYMGHAEPLAMIDPRFKAVPPPQAFAFRRAADPAVVKTPVGGVPALGITALVGRPDLPGARPSAVVAAAVPTPAPVAPPPPEPVPVDLVAQAKAAADRGDTAGAVALCERAIKAAPSAEACALLGVVRLMSGAGPEAERLFTQALYLDPGHYDSLVHMMALAENRGDPKAAAQFRRRAEAAAKREGGAP